MQWGVIVTNTQKVAEVLEPRRKWGIGGRNLRRVLAKPRRASKKFLWSSGLAGVWG